MMIAGLVAVLLTIGAGQEAPPLPADLLSAQTVAVVNGGVADRIFTRSLDELRKWGRWRIVAEDAESDVTMTLTAQPTQQVHNWATGRSYPVAVHFMAITKTGTTRQLYGDTFRGHIGKELKRLGQRLDEQKLSR